MKPEDQRIKSIQNPANLNPIDPLAVENIDKDLIIHDFGINAPSFEYTLVLNKFNTVPDHVSEIFTFDVVLRTSTSP